MSEQRENRYKVCRGNAGFTQEQAADMLAVSTRTLSDYENGHARVPDDVVDSMASLYKSPLLAFQHLKETSVLGKYLPDIAMPQTNGDMAFQLILARDDLKPVVDDVKKIMADGIVSDDEKGAFADSIEKAKTVGARIQSVVIYAGA